VTTIADHRITGNLTAFPRRQQCIRHDIPCKCFAIIKTLSKYQLVYFFFTYNLQNCPKSSGKLKYFQKSSWRLLLLLFFWCIWQVYTSTRGLVQFLYDFLRPRLSVRIHKVRRPIQSLPGQTTEPTDLGILVVYSISNGVEISKDLKKISF